MWLLISLQLAQELLQSQNSSHRLEKNILEQRLSHMEQQVSLKDVTLSMADLRGENRKLWEAVDSLQRHGVSTSGPADTNSDYSGRGSRSGIYLEFLDLKSDVARRKAVVNQLKSTVGDLKAEWVMLKREVRSIQQESGHTETRYNALQADTLSLKAQIGELRDETDVIKGRLEAAPLGRPGTDDSAE